MRHAEREREKGCRMRALRTVPAVPAVPAPVCAHPHEPSFTALLHASRILHAFPCPACLPTYCVLTHVLRAYPCTACLPMYCMLTHIHQLRCACIHMPVDHSAFAHLTYTFMHTRIHASTPARTHIYTRTRTRTRTRARTRNRTRTPHTTCTILTFHVHRTLYMPFVMCHVNVPCECVMCRVSRES